MADLSELRLILDFPELSPADVRDVQDAADALPFGEDAFADRLRALADRMTIALHVGLSTHP